jgi:hypothetical protein
VREDFDRQRGVVFVPDAIAILRHYPKLIVSRRHCFVSDGALAARVAPFFVQAFEPGAKSYSFRCGERECRVAKLEASASRPCLQAFCHGCEWLATGAGFFDDHRRND